jgi:hypothetical protein
VHRGAESPHGGFPNKIFYQEAEKNTRRKRKMREIGKEKFLSLTRG